MSATTCPIDGCGASKGADHLYCLRHWRMVPRPLQTEIWDSWRALKRGRDGAAIATYREAVGQAEKIIADKEAGERKQGSLL